MKYKVGDIIKWTNMAHVTAEIIEIRKTRYRYRFLSHYLSATVGLCSSFDFKRLEGETCLVTSATGIWADLNK